jgi:hypothetical protein
MRKRKDPLENKNQLGNLLERYKKLIKPPQATVEKEAIVVIEGLTTIKLLSHQLTYTVGSRTLIIKAPSIICSELRVHHPVIIKELQRRLGAQNAPITIL